MWKTLFDIFSNDLIGFALSTTLLIAYHWMGMRAYYFAVPAAFWLFGPHFMVAASIAAVVMLHHLDHAPG